METITSIWVLDYSLWMGKWSLEWLNGLHNNTVGAILINRKASQSKFVLDVKASGGTNTQTGCEKSYHIMRLPRYSYHIMGSTGQSSLKMSWDLGKNWLEVFMTVRDESLQGGGWMVWTSCECWKRERSFGFLSSLPRHGAGEQKAGEA